MAGLNDMDFLLGTRNAPVESTTVVEQGPAGMSQKTTTVQASPEQDIRSMLQSSGIPGMALPEPEPRSQLLNTMYDAMAMNTLAKSLGMPMSDVTQSVNINRMLNPTAAAGKQSWTPAQALSRLDEERKSAGQFFNPLNPTWSQGFTAYKGEDMLSQEEIDTLQRYYQDKMAHAAMNSETANYYKKFLPPEMTSLREFNPPDPQLAPSLREKIIQLQIPDIKLPNFYMDTVSPGSTSENFIQQILGGAPTSSGNPVRGSLTPFNQ